MAEKSKGDMGVVSSFVEWFIRKRAEADCVSISTERKKIEWDMRCAMRIARDSADPEVVSFWQKVAPGWEHPSLEEYVVQINLLSIDRDAKSLM